jgi:hypothetical protein
MVKWPRSFHNWCLTSPHLRPDQSGWLWRGIHQLRLTSLIDQIHSPLAANSYFLISIIQRIAFCSTCPWHQDRKNSCVRPPHCLYWLTDSCTSRLVPPQLPGKIRRHGHAVTKKTKKKNSLCVATSPPTQFVLVSLTETEEK